MLKRNTEAVEYVLHEARENDVKFIRLWFTDILGGIKGFAITMPFKIDVLDYVHDISDVVADIGAANTIINEDGYLTAYNTDYLAAKTILD